MSETVIFNGIKFRRYPDAKRRSDRVYFTPNGTLRAQGVGRLHEEVWKAVHGPIPKGWNVHHIDGDTLNNNVENLECVTVKDHHARHWTPERAAASRQRLIALQPLAAEWHSSPAGKQWHAEAARRQAANRPTVDRICEQCAQSFKTRAIQPVRFCSNACKSEWRRRSGVDDIQRECAVCGEAFTVNRYAKKRTCSRACAGKSQSATKRGLQPDGRPHP